MRSFIVSILATLAFALFACAAPMPVAGSLGSAPVGGLAARHDGHDHPTLYNSFTKCIKDVKPHTDELAALKVGVKVEVILEIVAKITAVIKVCIEEVKVLATLKVEEVLCGPDGVAIGITVIASLCVQLILCIFNACAAVIAVISVDIQVQVLACLSDLCCLLAELICAVFDILVDLRVEIIACIIPQIAACIQLIVRLKVQAFIDIFCPGL